MNNQTFMTEKKYVYAIIKIPIEIDESGVYDPMKEYIDVEFANCLTDPRTIREPRESPFTEPLQNILKDFLNQREREREKQEQRIYRHEMKSSKKGLNTSFKIKPAIKKNYTAKNRSITEEEDVDYLAPQEVLE